MSEVIHAVVDENNLVVNVIVVGPDWTGPTIPVGDYAVAIGHVYNPENGLFFTVEGEAVLTMAELTALAEAQQAALLNQ